MGSIGAALGCALACASIAGCEPARPAHYPWPAEEQQVAPMPAPPIDGPCGQDRPREASPDREAAAAHTRAARERVRAAGKANDPAILEGALSEYWAAARGWAEHYARDPRAADAYASKFWLADALSGAVRLEAALGRPDAESALAALRATSDVRDTPGNVSCVRPAALLAIENARAIVRIDNELFRTSGGARGFPAIREVATERYEEYGESRIRALPQPIPDAVRDLVAAYDAYAAKVPRDKEPKDHPARDRFAYLAAETAFVYGQFGDARERFAPLYRDLCGTSRYAFEAWRKLITIAALERDSAKSRELAEANARRTCSLVGPDVDPALPVPGVGGSPHEAYRAFEAAWKTDERGAWQRAASLYRAILSAAPARDEAPEAAINGAIAFKHLGDYGTAIAMYQEFLAAYGAPALLDRLAKGDDAKHIPADPEKYRQHIKFLKLGYDSLAESYVLLFDYARAAATYAAIGDTSAFDAGDRRIAAENAVVLHLALGDRRGAERAKAQFLALAPPKGEQAEVEWRFVERGGDAPERFYAKWSKEPAAAAFTVQAAALAAHGGLATGWCDKTVRAFDAYVAGAGRATALGSPQADLAAECAYRALDAEMRRPARSYPGTADAALRAFHDDVERAGGYAGRLQAIIDTYHSGRWSVVARARQGAVYDACRARLLESAALPADRRAALLDELERPMVADYVEALAWARAFHSRPPELDRAVLRLGDLTLDLGDDRLRALASTVRDPATAEPFAYQNGMFPAMRRGRYPSVADVVVVPAAVSTISPPASLAANRAGD